MVLYIKINKLVSVGLSSIGVYNFLLGMVLMDLLLKDLILVVCWFFNILVEELEIVVKDLVFWIFVIWGMG